MAPDDDRKVKELIDAATEADLRRWFELPSFEALADQPPAPVVDEEMQAVIERRDRALAAVDPQFLDALRVRNEEKPQTLVRFEQKIDVRVAEEFGMLDEALIARKLSIADPREVELPDELRDDLKDCTPQALLRDLHRAEFDFDKQFEIVDFAAEQRFDIVAEVASAMATSWKLPPLGRSPVLEGNELVADVRAAHRRNWLELLPELRNRRVRE